MILFVGNEEEQWKGVIYMFGIITLSLFETVTISYYVYGVSIIALKLKTALTCQIFSKTLKLCPSEKQNMSGKKTSIRIKNY